MFPRLYAIVDAGIAGDGAVAMARKLVDAGVELVQYRDKAGSSRMVYSACREIAERMRGRGRFIVNDRADVAVLCGAGGVHVGQEDVRVEDARAVCGRERWIGISTHNIEQLRAADATSADYIAVGPVFPTKGKANPDPVVGLEFVREARLMTKKPLVAIGGIALENAADAWRAGADSVAVIGDLATAADPAERAAEYLQLARDARGGMN